MNKTLYLHLEPHMISPESGATVEIHEIHIAISQGNVIQVDGLPDEWEYTVHDVEQDTDE